MRKFVKISVTGLMALSIAATATGCLGTPPEPEEPPEPVEGAMTTMDDAYDWLDENKTSSTRPTIDGGYYDPKLPQIVEQKPAKITLSLPEGFTVSEDYNTNVMTYTSLILPKQDQITNETDLGDPIGWFNAGTGEVFSTETATAIMGDMTIAPYWKHKNGYNYVGVGSGKSGVGYNDDNVPGEMYSGRGTLTYSGLVKGGGKARAIHGGTGGSFLGSILADTQPVTAGAAIRLDSAHPQTVSKNEVIEYYYSISNFGTEPLKLSVYQISGSGEYGNKTTTYYAYESRYRVEIDLAPGEGTTAVAQYLLGKNGNALTYIVFEEDVTSFNFGIAIGSKIIDGATDVADAYKNQPARNNKVRISYNPAENNNITVSEDYLNQLAGRFIEAPAVSASGVAGWKLVFGENDYNVPAEVILPATRNGAQQFRLPSSVEAKLVMIPAEKLTVTYSSANGISAPSGAKTEYWTGDKLDLPAVSGATGTDGGKHAGWYDVATGFVVSNDITVTENMTLKPCFTYGDKLISEKRPNGSDPTPDPCTGCNWADFSFTDKLVVDNKIGYKVDYAGDMTASSTFRMKHTYAKLDGTKRDYSITIKNLSENTIKFTLWHVNSGTTWATPEKSSDNYGQNIITTLAKGESVTFTVTYKFNNTGNNTMLYFQMKEAVSNLSLGIAMYVNEATA